MTHRIRAVLPDETGAIAAALIAGDTHAIAPADADSFRNAGLAHILVIAGLHMGMVAGIAFFAIRALLALVPRIALYRPTVVTNVPTMLGKLLEHDQTLRARGERPLDLSDRKSVV